MRSRPWSFRVRLALLFGSLSLLMGLAMVLAIESHAARRLAEDRGEVLAGLAHTLAAALADNLGEREREILLLAQSSAFVDEPLDGDGIRLALERTKRAYRHHAWIGVTDAAGVVKSASGGLLEGLNAAERPWFQHGRHGVYVGDVHEAVMLAKKLKQEVPGEPLRFVDFAAPVLDAGGRLRGVVATHAHWTWVAEMVQARLPAGARAEGVEILVVSRSGQVLHPFAAVGNLALPQNLPSSGRVAQVVWPDLGETLTGRAAVVAETRTDLGWQVIVRQPLDQALQAVSELRRVLLLLGAAATALFMFLAWQLAAHFSRPLERLAGLARRIEAGEGATELAVEGGGSEVQGLVASLRGMTDTLLQQRRDLEDAKQSLEEKVEERTRQLEQLARRDALTGLHNRLAANERLREEFLRMKRSGRLWSVILLDIDHFKRVNDTYGHEAGDEALRHVAALLRDSLRATDFVARFGGEEFLIILPDTGGDGASGLAGKVRAAVEAVPLATVGTLTVSVGVAAALLTDANEDEPVRRADAALYRAKAGGRNRVETG